MNNGSAYIDALIKADFLHANFDIAGETVDTNARTLGARVEAGYRYAMGHGFFEPVASLAYVHSHIDGVTIGMTPVTFDDGQSLRGKIGGRIGASIDNGGAVLEPYVSAYVGNEFLGDNSIFLDSGPGLSIGDDVSGIFGEVGGGVSSTNAARNASVFAQGNYIFADGYQAGNLKAGARVNW
jgi:outer membrane autotransporter protein